jgi:serine/threonine-protein kinase
MANPDAAPARLGRYELLARLAAGGMGEIFLARLEGAAGFEKLFVIKRILPHLADDARFRGMLIAEARVASMMAHANICQVYELGETDGQLYIAMEYLEGVTLLPLLRKLSREKGLLDFGFVAGVALQAADALHYAHELRERGGEPLGIVHRDVTPTNLFLTEAGVIKVLDFGIAKVKDVSAHTQTGTVKGKYAYMAPEQLRGAEIDRRADVFALGVVIYEMLALRRLFQRKTDYLTFRAVMEQPIIDIRRYRTDCPDALAAALNRALDRDPEARFDTARRFGSAVLDAVDGLRRPWTQGEIGDFVRANFAAEMAQRSAQIASAVRAGAGRQTIPLISQPDEETTEIDDDPHEFGAVSSEVSETPVDVRHLRGSAERLASDEPAEPPLSPAPNLDALRAVPGPPALQPPAPIVVVNPRRNLFWPLVACAMVAVAAGALFLVWRQMQNQQPMSLVITNDRGSRIDQSGPNVLVVGPDQGSNDARNQVPPAPADPHQADPVAEARRDASTKPPIERRRPAGDPYVDVVHAKRADVDRCTTEHGNPPPGMRLRIDVGTDGHARSVAFDPVSFDATPLAACIKRVFQLAMFPTGPGKHLAVLLRSPS